MFYLKIHHFLTSNFIDKLLLASVGLRVSGSYRGDMRYMNIMAIAFRGSILSNSYN